MAPSASRVDFLQIAKYVAHLEAADAYQHGSRSIRTTISPSSGWLKHYGAGPVQEAERLFRWRRGRPKPGTVSRLLRAVPCWSAARSREELQRQGPGVWGQRGQTRRGTVLIRPLTSQTRNSFPIYSPRMDRLPPIPILVAGPWPGSTVPPRLPAGISSSIPLNSRLTVAAGRSQRPTPPAKRHITAEKYSAPSKETGCPCGECQGRKSIWNSTP